MAFKQIKIGDVVEDDEGLTGVVTEVKDLHNVYVRYKGKYPGNGLYCLVKCCAMYSGLKLVSLNKKGSHAKGN